MRRKEEQEKEDDDDEPSSEAASVASKSFGPAAVLGEFRGLGISRRGWWRFGF